MKTEIVRITSPEEGEADLRIAAYIIRSGGLVVFPTETVYGLGGDATNPEAAERIYAAKGRPSDNPLIIHVASPEEAEGYAYTTDLYYELARRFMPGPLTVILTARDTVPRKTRGGLDTVAVRCPENGIARALISLAGVPIAAPSANLSGTPSPTTARHVMEDMTGRVDMIIDGGDCDFGLESTIVKLEDDGTMTLLRPGKITAEELSEIAEVKLADAVKDKLADGARVLSPGMKYKHYAPSTPLVLLDGDLEKIANYIEKTEQSSIALLCYDEETEKYSACLSGVSLYSLGSAERESDCAHRLFALLRDVDKLGHSIIYARLPGTEGISLAIYNRMIRAAAHTIIKL